MKHPIDINLVLPIGPNGSHRLCSADDSPLPGAMVPTEAVNWLKGLRKGGRNILSIDLNGPGDVLASRPGTRQCLELLKAEKDNARLMITTLGLGGAEMVPTLTEFGVDQVNLLVQTVSEENVRDIYSWIRPGKKTLPLSQGAALLIHEQAKFCRTCAGAGITVNIQTIAEKGREDDVADIAETMAGYGAAGMEISGEDVDLDALVKGAGSFLAAEKASMEAVLPPPGSPSSCPEGARLPEPNGGRKHVAVASSSGMDVDLHLGQAGRLLIYGRREDGLACLIETRQTPPAGIPNRWAALTEILADCFCLLASHAGDAPRSQLAAAGISTILTTDQIEGVVDNLYGGGRKKKCKK